MVLRVGGLAEALGEARELEMRGAAFLEGQARLEEAFRLAPQLGVGAQASQGGEQLRVAAARREPALRALDAQACFLFALGRIELGRQLAVERDELGGPLRAERALQDLAREARLAERRGVARRRPGDARMDLVARRNAAPAPLEGLRVVGRAGQELDVRLHLVFLGE